MVRSPSVRVERERSTSPPAGDRRWVAWLIRALTAPGLPRDRSHSTILGGVGAEWHTAEVPPPAPLPAAASATDPATSAAENRLAGLLAGPGRRDRLTHVERVPGRAGRPVAWPTWAHPDLVDALRSTGVAAPWSHQAQAAELVRA